MMTFWHIKYPTIFHVILSSGGMPKDHFSYCMTVPPMPTATFIWVRFEPLLRDIQFTYPQVTGHALNKVTKDIINRFHVSQGRKVQLVFFFNICLGYILTLLQVTYLGGIVMDFQLKARQSMT